ncbi:MAG TPA: trigger factor [Candidatus Omnitrophota bacterium]|nr:trigger factor [Candidatus Omnitrophota bacterium]HPS37698.1 trigger factor [Candidatus Omnitrophota bacterium]
MASKNKRDEETFPETGSQEVQGSPLKIKVQDGDVCEKILTIEIAKDKIQEEFEAFYKAVAPRAKVPGFRPGKVPQDVLVMHYEKEANDSVLEHLLSDSLPRALREKVLQPLTTPEINDIQFTKEKLVYKAKVEIRPKVKLNRVTGLSAKKEKPEVKAEEIEKALKQVQEMHAQYKAVEGRAAKIGDFLIADYVCTIDGKEVEKRNDDWMELKGDEYLKGFSAQLVGVNPGDEKEVQITFPQDVADKKAAGKTATFKVKVKEIKEKNLPALDDELAKQAGEYKDFSDLKQKVTQDIEKRLVEEKEAAFERELLNDLVKQNKIDIPAGLLKRRAEHLIDQARQRFLYQGGTEDLFDKEKEKMLKDFEAEARRQIHVAFLLDEIAEAHKVTADEADLKKKFEALSAQYRQPQETVEKYYQEHQEALESLLGQVRNEKVIEFLKQNAKIK